MAPPQLISSSSLIKHLAYSVALVYWVLTWIQDKVLNICDTERMNIKVAKKGLLANLPLDEWKEKGKSKQKIFLELVSQSQQMFDVN